MHEFSPPKSATELTAFFWGVSCFLPVGIAYLAATALISILLIQGMTQRSDMHVRWQQARKHATFWPACFFIAWVLLILCFLPHYAETPSNLFHALRIALTIILVLMLREAELRAGLLGWIVGAVLALAIIYANRVIPLPHVPGLRDLLQMNGNKSIGIAVSLAIFASCTFLYSLGHFSQGRRWAILGPLLVIPVLIWWLPSRTSLILFVLTLMAGLIHYFWIKPSRLLIGLAVAAVVSYGLSQTPQLQQRFAQGFVELQNIQEPRNASNQALLHSSWGMRYLLYTHTTNMLIERPWMGWGIGSWNDQWRQRTPSQIHQSNMPHNDFLWMGAQAGLPGALALLAIMLSLLLNMFRLRSFVAACSVMATTGLLIAMSLNSALRDAQIGLSVLFVVVAMNALAWRCRDSTPLQ